MKFFAALIALPAVTFATSLSWDPVFDNPNASLDTVACSDGMNGLITRGYTTFGSLENFPNIGAIPAITDWNSTNCGTCWNVTYTNGQRVQKSINILGIDIGHGSFNVAKAAMNNFTDNQADQLGRINVEAVQIAASNCGLWVLRCWFRITWSNLFPVDEGSSDAKNCHECTYCDIMWYFLWCLEINQFTVFDCIATVKPHPPVYPYLLE